MSKNKFFRPNEIILPNELHRSSAKNADEGTQKKREARPIEDKLSPETK